MSKIVVSAATSILLVVTLKILSLFSLPFRELIFAAVSLFYFLIGCVVLKRLSPKVSSKKFFRCVPLRGENLALTVWFTFTVIAGGMLLNLLEVSFWSKVGITLPANSLDGLSIDNAVLMLFLFALIPAVFEELFFRGAVLSSLQKVGGFGFSIALSSLLFFLAHGSYYYVLSVLFSGVCFSLLVYMTNSIFSSMAVHFFNNVFSYLLMIFSTRLANAGFSAFVVCGLIFFLLIGIYGVIATYERKIKNDPSVRIEIFNEGELVWQRERKRRKRQGK